MGILRLFTTIISSWFVGMTGVLTSWTDREILFYKIQEDADLVGVDP